MCITAIACPLQLPIDIYRAPSESIETIEGDHLLCNPPASARKDKATTQNNLVGICWEVKLAKVLSTISHLLLLEYYIEIAWRPSKLAHLGDS